MIEAILESMWKTFIFLGVMLANTVIRFLPLKLLEMFMSEESINSIDPDIINNKNLYHDLKYNFRGEGPSRNRK